MTAEQINRMLDRKRPNRAAIEVACHNFYQSKAEVTSVKNWLAKNPPPKAWTAKGWGPFTYCFCERPDWRH